MTRSLSLAFLLLSLPSSAQQAFHAGLRFGNIPDGAAPLAVAADAAGNFYIVSNVPTPSGGEQIRIDGVDPDGNSLANFEIAGGAQNANAAIDPAGNLVIVGTTSSPDFPLVSPLFNTSEGIAAFVVKLDGALKSILFSTELGGTQALTYGRAVALDRSGNIYVTGETEDTGFPVTPGAFQPQPPQGGAPGYFIYTFVTEISSSGQAVLFSTYFGPAELTATSNTIGSAIALDATGNVVVAGYTSASNLPITAGVFGPSCGACFFPETGGFAFAGFIAKLSANGSGLLWATYVPATTASGIAEEPWISAIAVDASGNVIAVGKIIPPNADLVPLTSPPQPGPGFVMKCDSGAQKLLFSTYFGGQTQASSSLTPGANAVAVDSQGLIWITGGNYLAGASSSDGSLAPIFTAPSNGAGVGLAITANGVTSLGSTGALLTASPGEGPALTGIENSAGFTGSDAVAPYERVTIEGLGIGPQTEMGTEVVNGVVTNSLGVVQGMFDGTPAPLLYAGPTQINAVVPSEVYGQDTTKITVVTPSSAINGPTMQLRPSQPGVFLNQLRSSNSPLPFAAALNQDGSPNSAINPAAPGTIVSVWVTGAGLSNFLAPDGTVTTEGGVPTLPVSAFSESLISLELSLGGFGLSTGGALSLEIDYAGDASGMVAGVTQVNFRLPSSTQFGGYEFWLQIGFASSEPFTLYMKSSL